MACPITDFVSVDGNWDWQCLVAVLPSNVCDLIASLAPPSQVGTLDCIAWNGNHDGNFSIHSYYDMLAGTSSFIFYLAFRLIWKRKGLERAKVSFGKFWLMLFKPIFFWFTRHVAIDPKCSCCSLYEHETALHVLRDCPIALDFWHRLVDPML